MSPIHFDARARDIKISQALRDVAREASMHRKAQRIARAHNAMLGCVAFVSMFAIALHVIA